MHASLLLTLASASSALAFPLADWQPLRTRETHEPHGWDHGAVTRYNIHQSCNVTERRLLQRGLDDAVTLATHARDHALRFGNSSELYRRYFGNAPTAEVTGNLDRVVNADRADTLFRCDDPDGNCKLPEWGGHWRGENATDETVICPLTYSTRLFLEYFCTQGYTVSSSPLNTYFGIDLIHRLYHMPAIGQDNVQHFADSHEDVLEFAKTNSSLAVKDSHALQYFVADVYAYDIAVPEIGCSGDVEAGAPTTEIAEPTPTATTPPTETQEVPPNCHTHEGGDMHCT